MLTEKALVRAVDNEYVWLEPRQTSYCGKCSLKKGCGHYLLANFRNNRNQPIKARISDELKARNIQQGDTVTVALDEKDMLRLSSLFYGLPLLILLVAAMLASMARLGEGLVLISALLALVAGIGLSRRLVGNLEDKSLLAIDIDAGTGQEPVPLHLVTH